MPRHPRQHRRHPPAEVRFWVFCQPNGKSCWAWLGATNGRGYPVFRANGRTVLAARFMWKIEFDEDIPQGHRIVRRCGNKACMNPSHWALQRWGDEDEGWDDEAKERHRALYAPGGPKERRQASGST